MLDPRALKLYVDGNAYDNPGGNAGMACVAEYPESWNRPDEEVFSVGFHESTNNRMELKACLQALEYVRDHAKSMGVERVQIVTDSLYVHDNQHMPSAWRKNGWKTNSGRAVENPDLWKRFLSLGPLCTVRVDIIWQKGKKSVILKVVDKGAKAAGKAPTKHDRGFRQGKVSRSKIKVGASSLFPANGQEKVIRIYRSALVGKTSDKVYFDVFDEIALDFREKCRASVVPGLIDDLHRGHAYRVRFNSDERNPQIVAIIEEVQIELPKEVVSE